MLIHDHYTGKRLQYKGSSEDRIKLTAAIAASLTGIMLPFAEFL